MWKYCQFPKRRGMHHVPIGQLVIFNSENYVTEHRYMVGRITAHQELYTRQGNTAEIILTYAILTDSGYYYSRPLSTFEPVDHEKWSWLLRQRCYQCNNNINPNAHYEDVTPTCARCELLRYRLPRRL